MQREYQITGKNGSRELARFLAANVQVILLMVELIEECKTTVDERAPFKLLEDEGTKRL